MKKRTAWFVSMFLAGAAALAPQAMAQMPPGIGQGPYGPQMAPGMPNPYAPPMYAVAPMGYADPGAMGMGMDMGAPAPYPDPMLSSPVDYSDPALCDDCGVWGPLGRFCRGPVRGVLSHLLPFDDGGCCAPHWFDVHAEYVNLQRDDISRRVDFQAATPLGPIVLSTDDLDFDSESGFRITFTRQVGVGSNLEFMYMGTHNWSSSASVTSANDDLFSVYSGFGAFPLAGQGFTETDEASFASIAYSSKIDNVEVNFRQRWQGYGCRLQGSWLAGMRYFQLDEDFIYRTISDANAADQTTTVGTYNALVGGQGGGDIWLCVIPGLSIGAETKLGFYLNDATAATNIVGTTLVDPFNESVDDVDAAFVGELSFMLTWRLTQSWSFRGSYDMIWVAGVALAPENFNANPPFLVPAFTNPPRDPFVNTHGDIFLHGFTAGFEYMW